MDTSPNCANRAVQVANKISGTVLRAIFLKIAQRYRGDCDWISPRTASGRRPPRSLVTSRPCCRAPGADGQKHQGKPQQISQQQVDDLHPCWREQSNVD